MINQSLLHPYLQSFDLVIIVITFLNIRYDKDLVTFCLLQNQESKEEKEKVWKIWLQNSRVFKRDTNNHASDDGKYSYWYEVTYTNPESEPGEGDGIRLSNLHREDGPARLLKRSDGLVMSEQWVCNGLAHRNEEDGPSYISRSDAAERLGEIQCVVYEKNGKMHRENGPASIHYSMSGSESRYWYFEDRMWLAKPTGTDMYAAGFGLHTLGRGLRSSTIQQRDSVL